MSTSVVQGNMNKNNAIRRKRTFSQSTESISVCAVCVQNNSSYKCPVCLIKYCSVACFKKHKDGGDCIPKVEPSKPESVLQNECSAGSSAAAEYEFETDDTVPVEKLKFLGKDKVILKALQNPHLRKMMVHLDSSKNPSQDIANAMREPVFVELATRCLHVIEKGIPSDSDSSSDDSSDD